MRVGKHQAACLDTACSPSQSSHHGFVATRASGAWLLFAFLESTQHTKGDSADTMAGFGRSNSLSINTGGGSSGGGLLYVPQWPLSSSPY
jgi:hypothetical protein